MSRCSDVFIWSSVFVSDLGLGDRLTKLLNKQIFVDLLLSVNFIIRSDANTNLMNLLIKISGNTMHSSTIFFRSLFRILAFGRSVILQLEFPDTYFRGKTVPDPKGHRHQILCV